MEIANGGVGVYIYNLIKQLREVAPANQYFLIRSGIGWLDVYGNGRGGKDIFLPERVRIAHRLLDVPIRRVAAAHGLDLIHYPNQFGGAFLPASIRRVVTLHDLTPLLYPRFHPPRRVWGYRLLLRRALRAADRIIVDSRTTLTDLVERGLAPRSKVVEIALGVADRFRHAVMSADFAGRYDLPARFILSVGVLEPRKNHALLFEVLHRLHQCGEQIGLVIAGRQGWGWSDPLSRPALAHLRPWVRIFRDVPDADLPEFYLRAELFAYPSFYEGFGLPITEAMACSTPAVLSKVSSLLEVAGDAALFADPASAEDFTTRILSVLRDPALRRRLIEAGKRRVEPLTWRRTAERTLEVYQSVCGRGGA